MKKLIRLIIGFCIFPSLVFAQQTQPRGNTQGKYGATGTPIGQVIGRVVSSRTNKGIGFATIEVLRAKDSSQVTGVLSGDNGDFTIDQLPPGKFILQVNFIGTNSVFHTFVLTPGNLSLDLGNFKLTSSAVTLQGITITANTPAYTMSLDKKVFDASKSLVSAGGDATDVLKQIPSVNVDIDGNVTLRNGTPKIYIDGKQTQI
jgi:hypothetical protein